MRLFLPRTLSIVALFCLTALPGILWGAEPVPPASLPGLKDVPAAAPTLGELPLAFSADFEDKAAASHFEPTDSAAWKVVEQQGNHIYALLKRHSDYDPPHRSPYNISLIKGLQASSLVLDVHLQSSMTDYPHRSLCLFFNYQDPDHFYYVHFGQRADPHANQVFIVNGAARQEISDTTTKGTPWDHDWHHARIVRDVDSGRIAVYFDDMTKPAMAATDKTFRSGQLGIGSFDDTGSYDVVRVYAIPILTPGDSTGE